MTNFIRNLPVKSWWNKVPKLPLILLAGGLLVVLVVRTDWNTIRSFTSRDGGFSIRFPIFFSIHVNQAKVQGRNEFHTVKNIVELDAYGYPAPYILIGFSNNVNAQPIDEFIQNTSECDEITDQHGEKVMVAGLEGRLFKNISCNSGGETRIYFENGSMGYTITFHGKPVDEKMLSLIVNNFSLLPPK